MLDGQAHTWSFYAPPLFVPPRDGIKLALLPPVVKQVMSTLHVVASTIKR